MANLLPDKLSDLIRVAVRDLTACEADDNYTVKMNNWHWPRPHHNPATCYVCLAGAVLAKSVGFAPYEHALPCENGPIADSMRAKGMTNADIEKLYALDKIREGNVANALVDMKQNAFAPPGLNKTMESPAQFKKSMENIADYLAAHGL